MGVQVNQNTQYPGIESPRNERWIHHQSDQLSEVMPLLLYHKNKIITGNITFVTPFKSAGIGNTYFNPLHIKYRITFPKEFKALSYDQIRNMKVEGKLIFNEKKTKEYVKNHYHHQAFYSPELQNMNVKDIPIRLLATGLIMNNRKIKPEILTIVPHIQSLFGKSVTADIVKIFDNNIEGIASHLDEKTGFRTRFHFLLPEQLKNTPAHELSADYEKLEAIIEPMNESNLINYISEVGYEAFIGNYFYISEIALHSREVSFLPKAVDSDKSLPTTD